MPNSRSRGARQSGTSLPAARPASSTGELQRILDTPRLAEIVPRLQPQLLHRVIDRLGLEDCGELVALATPAQLAGVFDVDLWKASLPGADEQFDAARFGTWITVLIDADADTAAAKIAGMDPDLIAIALAQHVRVFDVAAMAPAFADGEAIGAERSRNDLNCEIAGYLVEARRSDAWDAIIALLLALHDQRSDCFHRLMAACRRLSNRGFERDGLDDLSSDREQQLFDLAVDREERREQQGFVSAPQARAFLQTARDLDLAAELPRSYSPIATAYFRAINTQDAPPDAGPESRARLTAHDDDSAVDDRAAQVAAPPHEFAAAEQELEAAVAAISDAVLGDIVSGSVATGSLSSGGAPRRLLAAASQSDQPGGGPPLSRIRELLDTARGAGGDAYLQRTAELAYLANVLVAGCSFQQRTFTLSEASDAAIAVCNLGLERWPAHWEPARADGADLLAAFQIGWAVLYREVCLKTTDALIGILAGLRLADRDLQIGLNGIRIELIRQRQAGTPWRACELLDVLMALDQAAWAALLGLLDECPVLHPLIDRTRRTPVLSFTTSDYVFISTNAHMASVDPFIESLPSTLRG